MYPEPDTTFWNFDKINKIIYFNIDNLFFSFYNKYNMKKGGVPHGLYCIL